MSRPSPEVLASPAKTTARTTEPTGNKGTSIPLPNLTWCNIVSSREGTPTQGQCILDLIEVGEGTISQLSIIHRPVAPSPPTVVRGSTRPSVPPDYLEMVSPICHVAPSTVHYHLNTDPTSLSNIYLARSNREGESCFRTYTDRRFKKGKVLGMYAGKLCPSTIQSGKHIFSDRKNNIAVDASSPTSCTMRYAGDTFDLLDGNNTSIHYCAELNIF
jgi:hypothetical protein